jgi:hypothetical protein
MTFTRCISSYLILTVLFTGAALSINDAGVNHEEEEQHWNSKQQQQQEGREESRQFSANEGVEPRSLQTSTTCELASTPFSTSVSIHLQGDASAVDDPSLEVLGFLFQTSYNSNCNDPSHRTINSVQVDIFVSPDQQQEAGEMILHCQVEGLYCRSCHGGDLTGLFVVEQQERGGQERNLLMNHPGKHQYEAGESNTDAINDASRASELSTPRRMMGPRRRRHEDIRTTIAEKSGGRPKFQEKAKSKSDVNSNACGIQTNLSERI